MKKKLLFAILLSSFFVLEAVELPIELINGGYNFISNPMEETVDFPIWTSSFPIYKFESMCIEADPSDGMSPGVGYFVHIHRPGLPIDTKMYHWVEGTPMESHSYSIRDGWTTVGGLSRPKKNSSFIDESPIIEGVWYTRPRAISDHVENADLHMGKGCWVKSDGDGSIAVNADDEYEWYNRMDGFTYSPAIMNDGSLIALQSSGSSGAYTFEMKRLYPYYPHTPGNLDILWNISLDFPSWMISSLFGKYSPVISQGAANKNLEGPYDLSYLEILLPFHTSFLSFDINRSLLSQRIKTTTPLSYLHKCIIWVDLACWPSRLFAAMSV